MIQKKTFVIPGSNNRDILADITFSSARRNRPLVIFCHGYKGFKDWGPWNEVAEEMAMAGYVFLKFNFSHNGGTIEDPIDFPDLEAFGHNTFSIELDDINDVLDYLYKEKPLSDHIDLNKNCIIGHSRGGGMSLIKASMDNRLKSIITWASISDIERRMPTGSQLEQWEEEGVLYVTNGRTKQEMPHYFAYYEDYNAHKELLNIERATRSLNIPHLIIHGDMDKSVLPEEAEALKTWNPDAILHVIKNCGHTFETVHPWHKNDQSVALKELVESTINFLEKVL